MLAVIRALPFNQAVPNVEQEAQMSAESTNNLQPDLVQHPLLSVYLCTTSPPLFNLANI